MPDIAKPASGADPAPAAQPKSENPLLEALFSSAPAPSDGTPAEAPPSFGRSLTDVIQEEKDNPTTPKDPKDPAKADPAKAADPAKGAEPKDPAKAEPAAKADPAKPVKLTRRLGADPAAPAAVAPVAKADPAAPAKTDPKAGDDAEFEKTLEPEEAEQVALLRFAAGRKEYGEKYKGAPEKAIAFIKKHVDFIAKKKDADPEYDFSEANPEYQAWLKANKPAGVFLSPAEVRKIEKDQLRAEYDEKLTTAISSEREATAKKELIPTIKRRADTFHAESVALAMPEDMAKVYKEQGAEATRKAFPDEFEILEDITNATANSVESFLSLVHGVQKFDPANQTHLKLDQFIAYQCDDFLKNAGTELTQGGKAFVSRADWNENKSPEFRAKHWTFTDAQVVEMIKEATKTVVAGKIAAFHKRQEERGWKRGGAAAPAGKAAAEPKQEDPPAKVKPSPQGGGGGEAPTGNNPVLSALGMSPST